MKLRSFIYIFGIAFIFSSCSQKIAYTKSVEKRYNIDSSKRGQLQYYLMDDLTLYVAEKDGTTVLEDGEIVINEDENVDKVIFRAGTRGVYVSDEGDHAINIRFESGDKWLTFGSTSDKGKYLLQAKEWKSSGRGVVEYGGKKYLTNRGAQKVFLSVKLRRNSDSSQSQRVAKGVKL